MESTNKKYVMIFSISFIVCIMAVIIALVFLLPQQYSTIISSINTYESVNKSDYSYTATKDIEENALVRNYIINSEQLQAFKNKYQYIAGNSDPFTPYVDESQINDDTSGNGSSNSNGNNNNNTTTNNKITNSNGGIPNPPSTNK